LKNRIYPYPIYTTSEDDCDYLGKPFEVKLESATDLIKQEINFLINFQIHDFALSQEMQKGNVLFVTHIECPTTNYFNIIKTNDNNQSINIGLKNINQTVQLVTFLVVNKDIYDFHSSNFKGIFANTKYYFERGNIIGIGDSYKININKDTDKIAKINSIFEFNYQLNDNINFHYQIDVNENKIHIYLPKKHYDYYASAMHNPSLKPSLVSLFIFPTLVSLLGKIQNEESINFDSIWVKSILKSYKKKTGEEFDYENRKSINPILMAQQLYDSPVINGFEYILKVGEGKNYGEE
jgi:hypothetical protein